MGVAPYPLKFSFSPGSGQRISASSPLPESVIQAVRMSGPPKQRLVGWLSGIATSRTTRPSGAKTVITPVTSLVSAVVGFYYGSTTARGE